MKASAGIMFNSLESRNLDPCVIPGSEGRGSKWPSTILDWNIEKIADQLDLNVNQVLEASGYYVDHSKDIRGLIRERRAETA